MNRLKKSLTVALSLWMLTGCSYKGIYTSILPSSTKDNSSNIMSKEEQQDGTSLVKKSAKWLNSSYNNTNAQVQTASAQTTDNTVASQKTSSIEKPNNTPKKIIAQAPKSNMPAAKPNITNTVQKVQLPLPPANSTGTESKPQTNAANSASSVQSIPGLPPINYAASSYNEFYNAIYSSLKNFDESVYIKVNNYNENTYNLNVIDSILTDNYDVDYGLKSVKAMLYSMGSINVLNIQYSYSFTRDKLLNMRDASQAKASKVISEIIKPGMTDLNKEKAIHDYIITHTSYDYKNYLNGTLPGEDFNDYGILMNGNGVCEGYSKAMLKLMRMAGLQAKSILGYGLDGANKIPHAWNMVKINGTWTLVDATWDDPVPDEGNLVYYNYFDISDSDMAKDHQWDMSKYPKASSIAFSQ